MGLDPLGVELWPAFGPSPVSPGLPPQGQTTSRIVASTITIAAPAASILVAVLIESTARRQARGGRPPGTGSDADVEVSADVGGTIATGAGGGAAMCRVPPATMS